MSLNNPPNTNSTVSKNTTLNSNPPSVNSNTLKYSNTSSNKQSMLSTVKNTIQENTQNLSPLVIFIIVLIFMILMYILVNYVYSQIVNSREVKVSKNILLDVITDGMTELEIGSNKLPNSTYSNEYSISLWVYVDNFDYKHGERKFILRRGDIKSVVNPEIYIHPTQNKLQLNVSLSTDINGTTTPTTAPTTAPTTTPTTTPTTAPTPAPTVEPFDDLNDVHDPSNFEEMNISRVSDEKFLRNIPDNYDNSFYNTIVNDNVINYESIPSTVKALNEENTNVILENFGNQDENCNCDNLSDEELESDRLAFENKCGKCFVDDFPLQKWVHMVVSQYNNVMDIYLDGKLNSSCVLQGFPDVSTDNLVLSPDGGYSGQMSSVVYYNSALAQDDVFKIYSLGPEGDRNVSIISRLKEIPTWVYIVITIFIILLVVYSFFM